MLTGVRGLLEACSWPQELFARVTIGGRELRLNMYNSIHCNVLPHKYTPHCGRIEAKLLVGGDARWLPSASHPPLPRGSELSGGNSFWSLDAAPGCLNYFGSHISEANMGQTPPDRRVILRGLGFWVGEDWGRGENWFRADHLWEPPPSPPSSPLATPLH